MKNTRTVMKKVYTGMCTWRGALSIYILYLSRSPVFPPIAHRSRTHIIRYTRSYNCVLLCIIIIIVIFIIIIVSLKYFRTPAIHRMRRAHTIFTRTYFDYYYYFFFRCIYLFFNWKNARERDGNNERRSRCVQLSTTSLLLLRWS